MVGNEVNLLEIVQPTAVTTITHKKTSSKEDEANLSVNNISIRDLEIMTTQLKYERDIQKYLKGKQTQMNTKINELTEKLINLENQYKILSFKYSTACEKIDEINIIIDNKVRHLITSRKSKLMT